MKARDILHCDLDAFFASVEQRDHPEYRGKPVIVGGSPEARGVVATCSYETRRFGVHSAMPVRRAMKLCPEAVLLPVDFRRYREVSGRVRRVWERFTPEIEVVSIDEAYLAVEKGTGMVTAAEIRAVVSRELNLPLSIGVSTNKLLAKIACGLAKPNGLKALWPADVPEVLWPLPADVLPGVGPKSAERLAGVGVVTVGDLVAAPVELLRGVLGNASVAFQRYAQGLDTREFTLVRRARSVSEETTFPQDVADRDHILAVLMTQAEEVGHRLRAGGAKARTVTLKLRFASFRTITRSVTLFEATDSGVALYRAACELFDQHSGRPPWRLVGIKASGLTAWEQLSLLPPSGADEKLRRVENALDGLRARYGRQVVFRARRLMHRD
ncbi:MAG: DNA polymerase IV [Bacillota bacterium]